MQISWFRQPAGDDPGSLNLCYAAVDLAVIRGAALDPAVWHPAGELDYATLLERVAALAGAMRGLGVLPGAPVGVLLDGPLDELLAVLAATRLGAVVVALDPDDPAALLTTHRPALVVTSRRLDLSVHTPAAVLLHGLYDHLMLARGPALLLVAVPLFAFMFGAAWIVLRSLAPESDSADASSKLSLLSPPSLSDMRRAMQRTERPLMLHWIALGALVTLGVVLASLAGAIYLGHRLGIDFTLANESDLQASGPLVLLGSAVLFAFPLSGYLIARASGAESVLEPALASGAAIAFVMLMLSVTEPVALVVAVVIAPLAFSLACGGAWFGLDRP